ncbi:OLC1v1002511C1 [Oldenlandia corymbosa var. corymbosa]|uniref:mitogen-activated protein kinase kinase kinase n=1 Tax=Oldenlandia corymbosa var. corymbosa TaxID=529605 RepID=A0AAV1D7T1_OLDCO|nr:OLC1v1002511C1 [Oldenlandia corymbosa var. corymbosa]
MMNYAKLKRNSRPRLDRRNANNNINYEASDSPSTSSSSFEDSSSSLHRRLQSLDHLSSFRVEGVDGEFDLICRSLGLSGPEDFSIPLAAWEASKTSSPSADFRSSRLRNNFGGANLADSPKLSDSFAARVTVRDDDGDTAELRGDVKVVEIDKDEFRVDELHREGIRGFRPSKLAPPPVSTQRPADYVSSTWDIFRDFGPPVDEESNESSHSREGNDVEEVENHTAAVSESCSESSNDEGDTDDNSVNLAEAVYSVSPTVTSRRRITSWQKGDFLGSGSFGTVYEGFTDDGFFFAVKEVSLLDQGSQGRQSIYQLEQEISLLSQFQHENIVRYHGTEKDDSKLYIFLELVTKGSLLSLYQKYTLRDSIVSVYTRQILSGLDYLHKRNVVHRDIKCANILVHVSGSVKLADFGLAKATTLNDIKSCKGTAFWMAPEVVNGKTNGYGPAADIWSLGCTVLEMLTGRIPYSHLEGMQALFRIGRGEPPQIPNSLSTEAQDFLLKCFQVNPAARPTAAELLDHPFVKKPSLTFRSPVSPRP